MLLKNETKITNLTFPHLFIVVSHVNSPFCHCVTASSLPSDSSKLLGSFLAVRLEWYLFLINMSHSPCQQDITSIALEGCKVNKQHHLHLENKLNNAVMANMALWYVYELINKEHHTNMYTKSNYFSNSFLSHLISAFSCITIMFSSLGFCSSCFPSLLFFVFIDLSFTTACSFTTVTTVYNLWKKTCNHLSWRTFSQLLYVLAKRINQRYEIK